MAYRIQPTPRLKGKDAEKFERKLQENEIKMAPKEEILRCMEVFNKVSLNSNSKLS